MLIGRRNGTALGWFLALGLLGRGASAGIADLQGTQPGELLNGGEFASAENCSGCHRAAVNAEPPQPRDFMPFDTWTGTMMGNAARDPVFFAALAIANQDAPGVGTFCLRCHSPISFVRGHAAAPDGSGFDPEVETEGIVDGQGVGCDSCHRATTAPTPNDPYFLGNAQLVFGYEFNEAGGLIKYGPYENVSSPAHAGKQQPALADSRFCGQCHQVTNPEVLLRDASGTPTTHEFPLDTTYEEWASSDFRDGGADPRSCIDCHMKKKIGEWPVTKFGEPLRTDPRDHLFVGGNHWGIQAVMAANESRAQNYANAFQLALDATLASVASAAKVTLVQAPQQATAGQEVQLTVRVENLTGHKFPTGYAESRRAWIAVYLVDAAGAERPLLGGYDGDTGEIQREPPTHEYRAVHGRWNGDETAGAKEEHLALHDMIISDTRIPPKGFVASQTTAPTQEIDFGNGNDGYRNYDEVTFTVTLPADASGSQKLSARVYYQSMTREYIEFLRSENHTDDKGEKLEEIYLATGEAPPLPVSQADAAIEIRALPDNTGGGGAGGGGAAPARSESDDSCGCRTVGDAGAGWLPAAVAGLALAAAGRRRMRARR
jgi:MYXO-CTERM domain-containing protein